MSNRNSEIIIAKNINISKDYSHVLAISKNDLISLVQNGSHMLYRALDYSFLRDNNRIKLQVNYNTIQAGNFCVIINREFNGYEPYFYFIDEVIYVSDNVTEIKITEDIFDTYRPDSFNSAYVERQHTQNDNIVNLVNEDINFERYKRNSLDIIDVTPTKIMAEYSEYLEEDVGSGDVFLPTSETTIPEAERAGLVDTGLRKPAPSMLWRNKGYIGDSDTSDMNTLTANGIRVICETHNAYNKLGHGGSLLGVKTYPKSGFQSLTCDKLSALDGYIPVNKKLLQYPYYYINFSNNKGQSNMLKPEMFSSEQVNFQCAKCCHGIAQSFAYPLNYNGQNEALDFGLVIDNYPQLPMTVDSYSSYMGQRGSQIMAGVAGTAVMGAIGLATGNPLALASSAMSATSALTGLAFHPDNQGDGVVGRATGDFMNYCLDNFKFRIEHMTLTAQDAKRVDDYFTKFGYKQNEIQVIRTTNPRFNWHYVKTYANEVVVSGIPHAKADVINQAFSRGITFWNNNEDVGNYTINKKEGMQITLPLFLIDFNIIITINLIYCHIISFIRIIIDKI